MVGPSGPCTDWRHRWLRGAITCMSTARMLMARERLPVAADQPTQIDGVTVWYFRTGVGRRVYRSPAMDQALVVNVNSFDIIHLHSVFLWPTSSAARAARAANVPYVLSPRGMLVNDLVRRKSFLAKQAWISLFERRNIENAAIVHLTSEIEAAELRAFGFRGVRTAIVANGIELPDDQLSEGGWRATVEIKPCAPLCAISGSLELEEGFRSPYSGDEACL